jgi:uridine phosphorylase
MGSPNMDFFVREVRECLSGDLAIVRSGVTFGYITLDQRIKRLGSCGSLIDVPVATVVVPKSSVAVSRNVDFDFLNPLDCPEPAYRISKPVSDYSACFKYTYTTQVPADPILHFEVGLKS